MSPQILQNMLDAKFPAQINGRLPVDAQLDASSITVGKVDQGAAGASAWPVTFSATSRTPAISSVSSSGTVAAGKKSVDFIFSSDFTGTVLAVAFAGANDSVLSFQAPTGDTVGAIAYTVTTGSIRIVTLT